MNLLWVLETLDDGPEPEWGPLNSYGEVFPTYEEAEKRRREAWPDLPERKLFYRVSLYKRVGS